MLMACTSWFDVVLRTVVYISPLSLFYPSSVPTLCIVCGRGYRRGFSTPINMMPLGGRTDDVNLPSATADAAPRDAEGPSTTSPPAWSPMQSGNRDRAATGALPRIGLKRGRSDEEGNDRGGGGASLLSSGLDDAAAASHGNTAKRRALASRLSMGERRTWRAGSTPHAGARLLPAPPAPEPPVAAR